jgi:hypothetical protein
MGHNLELKYNKFYIGLSRDGQPYNFVKFRSKKNYLNLEVKLPQTDDVDRLIESSGLETLDYTKRCGIYRVRLTKEDVIKKADVLKELARLAYEHRAAD